MVTLAIVTLVIVTYPDCYIGGGNIGNSIITYPDCYIDDGKIGDGNIGDGNLS